MNNTIHYFFGEISSVNTTKILPSSEEELKKILDATLPKLIEKAETAAGSVAEAEVLCQRWKEDVNDEDIGLISIPLSKVSSGSDRYSHLVCWVYYNWATGGRISRSAHAVILSSKQWKEFQYDPFSIQGFPKSSNFFNNIKNTPELYNDHDSYMHTYRRYVLADSFQSKSDLVLLKPDVSFISIRHFLNSIEPRDRKDVSFWVGAFGVNENYKKLFNFGQLKKYEFSAAGNYLILEPSDDRSRQSFYPKLPIGDVEDKVLDSKINDLEKIRKSKPPSIIKSKKTLSKHLLFSILAFLFILIILISILFYGNNDSVYDSWLSSVKNNQKNIPDLIIEGVNIRKNAHVSPKQLEVVDDNLLRLSRELESKIVQLSSKSEGISAVNDVLKSLYSLRNIEWPHGTQGQWSYNKTLERLYLYQKEKFFEYSENNSIDKQKKLLMEIEESYNLDLPGFSNPYYSEMKKIILLNESSDKLDSIISSWRPDGANRHFYEVSNRLDEYRESFNSYHSQRIKVFEDEFFKRYAENILNAISKEYLSIRNNPKALLSSSMFIAYKVDLEFIPNKYYQLVPILDYIRFEDDVLKSPFVTISNDSNTFKLVLYNKKCANKPYDKLEVSLYETICVVLEKESISKLGAVKVVSSDIIPIKVFDLLNEKDYVSKIKIIIKWPNIKSYIRQ